ncbi:hypothetical protein Dda3937_04614 [Dickeya dadantii 3937]|uniref:Uncharacterized protein n=1 Tax=Dickeya dadantii (strain 3937) TaxID=198628 RepID=E0SG32_DICD3|nr:hypothetical protein Dda3937_04614 [Dickeya dadantii 3937]
MTDDRRHPVMSESNPEPGRRGNNIKYKSIITRAASKNRFVRHRDKTNCLFHFCSKSARIRSLLYTLRWSKRQPSPQATHLGMSPPEMLPCCPAGEEFTQAND